MGRPLTATLQRARQAFRRPPQRRLGALCLLTLVLSPIPGVGTLGYFSALVLCLPAALAGAGIGLEAALRQRARACDRDRLADLARMSAPEIARVVGLPLLILLCATVYNPNCDLWMGVAFHLMGPGCSALCGFTVGVVSTTFVRTPRRAWVAIGIVLLASTGIGLWRLYTQPCVYFLDPYWGWFSGPIYDEQVGITARYLRFRGYNALAVAGSMTLWATVSAPAAPGVRRPRDAPSFSGLSLAAALLAGALWLGLQPSRFGFTTDRAYTEEQLSGTLRTEHFVLHYPPNSGTALRIHALAAEHEFAWHELSRTLGRAPEGPIHAYIYRSEAQKRRLFGAGGVEVSLPWKRSLYLTAAAFPMRSLHHELAHTFGAAFGDPILGLSMRWLPVPRFNTALLEGFAVAMDPRPRYRMDIHAQAAALDALDLRPSLPALMGLGFYGYASSRAYTASGSFVRWLLETRGGARLGELYGTAGDFEGVYGETLATLESQWLDFLGTVDVADDALASMEERFKRRSVFQRPCAHRVARVRAEASRAQSSGDEALALELRNSLCELEPDRMEHYAALARVLATFHRFDDAFEVVARGWAVAPKAHSAALDASMAALEGDLRMATGELDGAVEAYERALSYPTDEATTRAVRLRRDAAADPAAAELIKRYFARFERVRTDASQRTRRLYVASLLTPVTGWARIGHYLLGRQLLAVDDVSNARAHLEAALDWPSPPSDDRAGPWPAPAASDPPLAPIYRRAALRTLAEVTLRMGDLDGCAAVLDAWREIATERGDLVALDKWSRRLAFHRSYTPRGNAEDGPRP